VSFFAGAWALVAVNAIKKVAIKASVIGKNLLKRRMPFIMYLLLQK
jgi:hypothetical protein